MENNEIEILLKRTIKNFINGKKKYNEENKKKAYEYFKQSLDLLSEIKNNYNDKIIKHKKLLNDTETECNKYLILTIESSINNKNFINNKESNTLIINSLYNNLQIGNIDEIMQFKCKEIDFTELINNNTILHWAIKFGDSRFLIEAFKLGARIDITNLNGNTLLEYACLEQDPNMIEILGLFGADMQKHLYFRNGTFKYITRIDSIDCNILLKIILSYLPQEINSKEISNIFLKNNNNIYNKIKLITNLINLNEKINFNDFTYNDLFNGLLFLLNNLSIEYALTYLNIIIDELSFTLNNKLGCPPNKLEIILVNLIPFIDYPFNISIDWVISLELKFLLLKLIKKKNSLNFKDELMNELNNSYINNKIIQQDYLGCLISQWISKIKI
jgi:ankyrin repeat protein